MSNRNLQKHLPRGLWWAKLSRHLRTSHLASSICAVVLEIWLQRVPDCTNETILWLLESVPTYNPAECSVHVSFSVARASLELPHYFKALYSQFGLLRVLENVWHFLVSVLTSTTCILEYASALDGWPRNVVRIERWELLNKVLVLLSLV